MGKTHHSGIRFTEGVDVWTCNKCGNVNIMGKNKGRCCVCGRDYADVLMERNGKKPKTVRKHESADPAKLRLPEGKWSTNPDPIEDGGFCQSFMKPKQEKK